ncbi:MAG: TIR domain-containing protein [Bdellovibrio sp.]|nr:TIR domain-containing protein [Bdellovibrio sp.]
MDGRIIFISHSSKDAEWAQEILAGLEKKNLPCWIAPRDVPAGANYASVILQALTTARAIVLLLTEESNQSVQVAREVDRAINAKIPIIPLRKAEFPLAPAMEYYLCNCQWIDVSKCSPESTIKQIELALQSELTTAASLPKRTRGPLLRWWNVLAIIFLFLLVGLTLLRQKGIIDFGHPRLDKLNQANLQAMSDKELHNMQLDILARRGFVFSDPAEVKYIEKFWWYRPLKREGTSDENNTYIKNKILTQFEKTNLKILEQLRRDRIMEQLSEGNLESTFPDQKIALYFCKQRDVSEINNFITLVQDTMQNILIEKNHVMFNVNIAKCNNERNWKGVNKFARKNDTTYAIGLVLEERSGPWNIVINPVGAETILDATFATRFKASFPADDGAVTISRPVGSTSDVSGVYMLTVSGPLNDTTSVNIFADHLATQLATTLLEMLALAKDKSTKTK